MLDAYRKAAGVVSFGEAASKCAKGLNGLRVQVESNPKGSLSVQVADHSGKQFWLSKVHVDKQ